MCGGGPKIVTQPNPAPAQPQKPVVYMRNQWLDGLGINAEQRGRNSLRIDRAGSQLPSTMMTGGPLPPMSGLGIGSR